MTSAPQPITPSAIDWLPSAGTPVELRCPVCHEEHRCAAVLTVPSLADRSTLTLYQCPSCDSKFFDPPDITDFSETFGPGERFPKAYVEVGGGIWEMYWPAACCSVKPTGTLLDVGCGFGFTVDAWERLRGRAIGVELAAYGREGARSLDVPIHSDYLQNIPDLRGRRFDVVYASEVIEHVPDPREFAELLSRYVADDGVLCLTTPNAEFIRKENGSSTLVAALSPGFHGFLIGPVAMERILRSCGFAHVNVRQFAERLIAWASRRPLDIDETSPAVRAEYLGYLESVLGSRGQDDVVTDGIAYRHFRDTVLAGQFDAARRSLARLETSLKQKYGPGVFDPARTMEAVRVIATADEFGAAYPWFLPNFYFVRGMYAKLSEHDEDAARRYFRFSRELTLYIVRLWGDMYALESLAFVPEAWQQEAVSAAFRGDPAVCVEWLAAIANGGPETAVSFAGNRPSNRQIERAFVEGLSILSSLNRPDALGKALRDCLDYLKDRYGDWLQAGPAARENMAGAALEHEQQMLLLLHIASACTRLGSNTDLVRPLLERVVQLGRMQNPPSAMNSAIASDAARRLAVLSAGLNRWGSSSTAYSLNVSWSIPPSTKAKS